MSSYHVNTTDERALGEDGHLRFCVAHAAVVLDLVAWYPDLTSRQERALHRANAAQGVGEWYPNAERARLLAALDALGRRAAVGEEDRELARVWAGTRGDRRLNEYVRVRHDRRGTHVDAERDH